jgi:geranylgeranyl pyrophosphate synthase
LVHDDLPALDDDDLRRGQPACHKAYGEASAILVGDYLVGAAFEWVTGPTAEIDVASQAGVCRLLARAWSAVCIGQHIDITANLAASAVSSVRRDELYRLKTGALFGAAAACAGVLAAAPATCVEELHSWGVSLGVAFQHLDDLRDGELHPTQAQPIVPTAQGCQLQLEQLLKIPCPITAQVLGLVLE